MEPRERSARRRHRAKRRGTPLRGWRHKADGLLQRRHESGMVFEAAVRGRRKTWPSDRSHSRKPAARGNCVTSHRPTTVCATATPSARRLHHRRPSPRRLAASWGQGGSSRDIIWRGSPQAGGLADIGFVGLGRTGRRRVPITGEPGPALPAAVRTDGAVQLWPRRASIRQAAYHRDPIPAEPSQSTANRPLKRRASAVIFFCDR